MHDHLLSLNCLSGIKILNNLWILGFVREFCGMVRKIFIYTREEVQKMNPAGSLNLKRDENPSVGEGEEAKEIKSQAVPSMSAPESS